ncbi:hypothetical protein J2D69_23125 [Lysinibacillus sphaericus]|uniref:Spore coat protein n=3 Tax=Lysinibacillus TaxID=400634 RepID=W7S3V9_LYSSH|nr:MULTISPECIES: hypothetical protein [Lysinibacillus]MBE5086054.1 hypothetical protein [Bacillus thuringiensis]ACA42133.1 Hypothetical yybI protein [Lysinibacillus sphaericus C3-41]AMO31611.1 hypothetical protein AR327_03450 [Lysinibacillus sphaericus]AMR89274.1 hypothetical protein A1T07_03220 [Lysinibacillus sphaericus]ANA47344.1 hypothetical protein A2J09_18430 [Lysinibacillus sphaericus]
MTNNINSSQGAGYASHLAPQVIQTKFGDINGDGFFETIFLMGTQKTGSPLWENLTLTIFYGQTGRIEQIPLKENVGYNPTIFLGDFTGNHIEDILVISDTGGSGGIINGEIFSSTNNQVHSIFDTESFNNKLHYTVNYANNYKAIVQSKTPAKKYIIDLHYKGPEYLAEIYHPDGTLKQPIEGWVDPISGLYPVDYDRDGTYEILAYQEIAGRYHADGLGYVENILKWDGHEFVVDRQTVSIFGEDLA